MDSIDSRTSPQLEHHRRSKSILKKSESSGYRNADPESERLISDNTSTLEMGSGSDYSPSRRLASPPAAHRSFSQRRPTHTQANYQQYDTEKTKTLKSSLFLLDDIINSKEKQPYGDALMNNKLSDSAGEMSLYICPPPPPMDEHSPTEETRLLIHNTVAGILNNRQSVNSIGKGPNIIS